MDALFDEVRRLGPACISGDERAMAFSEPQSVSSASLRGSLWHLRLLAEPASLCVVKPVGLKPVGRRAGSWSDILPSMARTQLSLFSDSQLGRSASRLSPHPRGADRPASPRAAPSLRRSSSCRRPGISAKPAEPEVKAQFPAQSFLRLDLHLTRAA